jgi:hypothetical protein
MANDALIRLNKNVLLLGSFDVGKSNILRRFLDDEFFKEHMPTIGVDFRVRSYRDEAYVTTVRIWELGETRSPTPCQFGQIVVDKCLFQRCHGESSLSIDNSE